jgi:DNA-binding NarL/FixJ family response regulator
VAVADEADVNVVSTTFRAGAHGVLLKSTIPGDLVAPLLAAASGHCVLPGSVLVSLVGTAVARRPELLGSLTPEDRQLWRMVADGVETMQIAETLFVSERTAKRMVALLLRRLGVSNRIQAAALAGQAGLLDSTPGVGLSA